MIGKLEGFNWHIAIVGFKNVQIKDINHFFKLVREKTGDACVQFFDATLIAGWEHLYFAALNASNAFKNGLNISKSLAIETLLYASAQRQIKEAVKLLGIKLDCHSVAVLILAESQQKTALILKTVSELLNGEPDDKVLELTSEKIEGVKKLFRISKMELEAELEKKGLEAKALTDLVIEHVALLAIQR